MDVEKVYNRFSEFDKVYCYPETDVLKNKLDVMDGEFLKQVERRLVSLRLDELINKPVKGQFDFEHLKKIHKYLFQDVYEWAGQTRTCEIAKEAMFCLAQHIDAYAEEIFGKLKRENYYLDYEYDKKVVSLANLFGDINALHPFREGNGRAQREFIFQLAKLDDIYLDLTNVSAMEMIEACFASVNGNNKELTIIFFNNARPIEKEIDKQL